MSQGSPVRRTGSCDSVASVGMGSALPPKQPPNKIDKPKFSTDLYQNKSTYDIIQYLFFCDEHKRVAVSEVTQTGVVILPFVALNNSLTWDHASEKGVREFFGKGQVDSVEGSTSNCILPNYKMNICQVLRIQLPNDEFEVRLTQFVKLIKTTGYVSL